MIQSETSTFMKQPGIQQFLKFCVVGATSFTIDIGLSYVLTFSLHMWWVLAKTISFTLAVTNGFIWNRIWTFQAVGQRRKRDQYAMFFLVNTVGWVLNVTIMKAVFFVSTGTWRGQHPTKPVWIAATLAATIIVVFWNFFANKHWTFRQK